MSRQTPLLNHPLALPSVFRPEDLMQAVRRSRRLSGDGEETDGESRSLGHRLPHEDRPRRELVRGRAGAALAPVDVWHDRAVFHFLTALEDRASDRTHLHETLKLGGTAIVATFALAEAALHLHTTPWGASQSFQYSRFRRVR